MGDRGSEILSDNNRLNDLGFAFSTLRKIREVKLDSFPFLKQSTDYALLLCIGGEQARGHHVNMNYILSSGISTPSTLIRRMAELEAAAVVRKIRSDVDKRNTFYELTDLPLTRVRHFHGMVEGLFTQR